MTENKGLVNERCQTDRFLLYHQAPAHLANIYQRRLKEDRPTQVIHFLCLVLFCSALAVQGQPPKPVGDQFQINTWTTGGQSEGAVAVDEEGGFVAVWFSISAHQPPWSIFGQRYASDGGEIGAEFQVNTYTYYSYIPSVATARNGSFVVTWASRGSGGTDSHWTSIQARRYASDGSALGDAFQVNTYTPYIQTIPTVAMERDGDFVIVWRNNDFSDFSLIQGQRFAANGSALGEEFQVSTESGFVSNPEIDVGANGDFVVVWENRASALSRVKAQRFAPDGSPRGDEFRVGTKPQADESAPSIAVDGDGDFVVAWNSHTASTGTLVLGQRFASDGSLAGSQFQVDAYPPMFGQTLPSVAADEAGGFVVAWRRTEPNSLHPQHSIRGLSYAPDGTPRGEEFRINTHTAKNQGQPEVGMNADGVFVVTWESQGSPGPDSDYGSVQGRRYYGHEIFTDGFESGDASAWTNVDP